MKKLIFTSLVFLFYLSSFAQASLHGLVTEAETGEPVIFANVLLKKGKNLISGLTDFDGRYEFLNLESGHYSLEVSYTGFHTELIDSILIRKGEKVKTDIQLKGGLVLEEVVVHGHYPAKTKKSTGKVITADEIKDLPTKNISALAATSAGLSISDGKKGKRKGKKGLLKGKSDPVVIRGSRSDATDYYINGIKVVGKPVTESEETPDIPSGQLTAGEWSDLDNWETWTEIISEDFAPYAKEWKIQPLERYSVKVEANDQRPLPNCRLQLLDNRDQLLWEAQTDHKGRAELWSNAFGSKNKPAKIKARYKDKEFLLKDIKPISKGLNKINFPVGCIGANSADICFVVDATSSMLDEIHYLKAEMEDVIQRIQQENANTTLRTGSVFYRDQSDSYLTISSPLTSNIDQTLQFIQNQNAAGGGDIPEAVETALDVALNQMDWNAEAINRLVFLILDAPPHRNEATIEKMQQNIRLAAQKGTKIIPLSASGINKDTEFLMKALAITTNATYTFLTDDSGIGDPHLEVTADVHDVKFLNDLMVEIVNRYLQFEDCPELKQLHPDAPIARQKNSALLQFIECYPNPATDFVNVRLQQNFDELIIKNSLGQVLVKKASLPQGESTIPLQNWAAGLYYLEFRAGEEFVVEKLVIQSEK